MPPDGAAASSCSQQHEAGSRSATGPQQPTRTPPSAATWALLVAHRAHEQEDFDPDAEAGDPESQFRYGMLLKLGRTDAADGPEQAQVWLRKAADAGHAQAKDALAK